MEALEAVEVELEHVIRRAQAQEWAWAVAANFSPCVCVYVCVFVCVFVSVSADRAAVSALF